MMTLALLQSLEAGIAAGKRAVRIAANREDTLVLVDREPNPATARADPAKGNSLLDRHGRKFLSRWPESTVAILPRPAVTSTNGRCGGSGARSEPKWQIGRAHV